MTDETTGATGTQADPRTQPPAGTSTSQADDGNGEQPPTQPESISLDEARKLRSEASTLRKRLKELDEAQKAAETAALSETEKKIAQAKKDGGAEVLTRIQAQIRRSEVRSALSSAGISAALLDLAVKADEFGELKVDDEGVVEGLGAAVEAFRKSHPDLFTKPGTTGTADGGTRGQPGLTREAIKKMSPEEVNANWPAVSEALARH